MKTTCRNNILVLDNVRYINMVEKLSNCCSSPLYTLYSMCGLRGLLYVWTVLADVLYTRQTAVTKFRAAVLLDCGVSPADA